MDDVCPNKVIPRNSISTSVVGIVWEAWERELMRLRLWSDTLLNSNEKIALQYIIIARVNQ